VGFLLAPQKEQGTIWEEGVSVLFRRCFCESSLWTCLWGVGGRNEHVGFLSWMRC